MISMIILNVATAAFAIAVAAGAVSQPRLSSSLEWLHAIIGITPPAPAQAQRFAIIWIVSTLVLIDALLFLFFFLAARLM
jgi:hypothetical protein